MPAGTYGMPAPRWVPEENDALIAARLQSTGIADPLAREFGDAPAREEFLREYFRSRAVAADGPCREMPIAAGPTVVRICQRLALEEGLGSSLVGGPADETWRDLVPGLLSRMAGLSSVDSGALIGVSSSTVSRRLRRHQTRLLEDPAYVAKVHEVGQEILWGAEKAELVC